MPERAREGDPQIPYDGASPGIASSPESQRDNNQNRPPKSYLHRNIENYLTSIPILLCCLCSGLIDATVFNAWTVFATMQTGNTVILALGASKQPPGHSQAWLQALMAILFFFLGAFFCNRATTPLGPLRHLTLSLSFLLQCALITTAAALVSGGIVPGIVGPDRQGASSLLTLIPLPMLSFQAGMQSVTGRQLGINEIPTTVLTSVYCDLGNDSELFAPFTSNWKRNRRFSAVICILVGAIIGGWLGRTAGGMAAALWMAAAIKGCISIGWLLWRSEKLSNTKD